KLFQRESGFLEFSPLIPFGDGKQKFFLTDLRHSADPQSSSRRWNDSSRPGGYRSCSDNFSAADIWTPIVLWSESRSSPAGGYRCCSDNFSAADISTT